MMNDAESKLKSLQEYELWVRNDPMKANMLALTTVIGNLTRQLISKGNVKQSKKYFGNSTPSIVASGNNKKCDPPKTGELLSKMFGKQMKSYCGKLNRGKVVLGWNDKKSHDDNYVPKPRDNSHKHENGRTPQINLTMT